jgi:pimeloyl-ACP methyl ester carboxylesterase
VTSQSLILTCPDGATIAYDKVEGMSPGIFFLHGLNSDRGGTKAVSLRTYCQNTGRAFVSIDMFGHGESSGEFQDGGISRWTENAISALDHLTAGPQIIIGSSMGGWVMLRAALSRPDRIIGLIGIAAAPDFTEDLIWNSLTEDQKQAIDEDGFIEQPNDYSELPTVISAHLVEDGRNCLLMRGPIDIDTPVRLLHGQQDTDVPYATSLQLAENLVSKNVEVLLIKDGDHRLSRDEDLRRLTAVIDGLCALQSNLV